MAENETPCPEDCQDFAALLTVLSGMFGNIKLFDKDEQVPCGERRYDPKTNKVWESMVPDNDNWPAAPHWNDMGGIDELFMNAAKDNTAAPIYIPIWTECNSNPFCSCNFPANQCAADYVPKLDGEGNPVLNGCGEPVMEIKIFTATPPEGQEFTTDKPTDGVNADPATWDGGADGQGYAPCEYFNRPVFMLPNGELVGPGNPDTRPQFNPDDFSVAEVDGRPVISIAKGDWAVTAYDDNGTSLTITTSNGTESKTFTVDIDEEDFLASRRIVANADGSYTLTAVMESGTEIPLTIPAPVCTDVAYYFGTDSGSQDIADQYDYDWSKKNELAVGGMVAIPFGVKVPRTGLYRIDASFVSTHNNQAPTNSAGAIVDVRVNGVDDGVFAVQWDFGEPDGANGGVKHGNESAHSRFRIMLLNAGDEITVGTRAGRGFGGHIKEASDFSVTELPTKLPACSFQ